MAAGATAKISARLPNPPKGYQRPVPLPVLELRDVIGGFRACCTACRGRMAVEPPTLMMGRVYCRDCDREMAEVVDRLPVPIRLRPEDVRQPSRRGRPPTPRVCGDCGDCSTCRTRAWRERQKGSVAS